MRKKTKSNPIWGDSGAEASPGNCNFINKRELYMNWPVIASYVLEMYMITTSRTICNVNRTWWCAWRTWIVQELKAKCTLCYIMLYLSLNYLYVHPHRIRELYKYMQSTRQERPRTARIIRHLIVLFPILQSCEIDTSLHKWVYLHVHIFSSNRSTATSA